MEGLLDMQDMRDRAIEDYRRRTFATHDARLALAKHRRQFLNYIGWVAMPGSWRENGFNEPLVWLAKRYHEEFAAYRAKCILTGEGDPYKAIMDGETYGVE